jgi:hypothetical protein
VAGTASDDAGTADIEASPLAARRNRRGLVAQDPRSRTACRSVFRCSRQRPICPGGPAPPGGQRGSVSRRPRPAPAAPAPIRSPTTARPLAMPSRTVSGLVWRAGRPRR